MADLAARKRAIRRAREQVAGNVWLWPELRRIHSPALSRKQGDRAKGRRPRPMMLRLLWGARDRAEHEAEVGGERRG